MNELEVREPVLWTLWRNARGIVAEMRPLEWSKNLLVFSGVIFSRSLLDAANFRLALLGFAVFCLASSSIYIFNDLCDIRADREHPIKRGRPLASGDLNINLARLSFAVMLAGSAIGAFALGLEFGLIVAIYVSSCVAYSLGLKHVVILDAIIIAGGFVLRAVAGAALIGVSASEWLVLCTSMVALLIAFGKRRHELALLDDAAPTHRRSLGDYSISFLDNIMAICAGAAIITYSLYTRADETVARIGSHWMLITIPFVIYGVFRYLFLIHVRGAGGDPVQILFRDRPTLLNLILWAAAVIAVIYLPKLSLAL
ncbi:MAG: decaprenyl-phosphate phosphoribosyltransferase [Acidobacteria bacterium]|nr:decaprenyl-phosphate phosphoribosyltransferase [Acidobacteriota bacterium]MCW5949741.1 decaprenyl-phosphate phosphoribosyltransferase [Pyrinomonadaceae bacterium]